MKDNISKIAQETLNIKTLETRNCDGLDFYEIVALKKKAGKINNALDGTDEINIFVKRSGIEFEQFGRVHTLKESMQKMKKLYKCSKQKINK